MADIPLFITTNYEIPVPPNKCQEVYVCLNDDCIAQTLDGSGIITATIQFVNVTNSVHQTSAILGQYVQKAREFYQYVIIYDDAQMADNEGTPYVLSCDCIKEINPYYCTLSKILAGSFVFESVCLEPLQALPDPADYNESCIVFVSGDGWYGNNGTAWIQIAAV